jgi:RNA polymerase sigma-70 factor (ECF subfamily)
MMRFSGGPINFSEIFRENQVILRDIAMKYTKDVQVAEDIVMNIFDKALIKEKAGDFKDSNHLKAFLFTAIKNACIDHFRAERKRNERLQNLAMETEKADEQEIFDVDAAMTIRNKKILDEINQLPPQTQKIIKLHFYEDQDLEQISAFLGITKRTVINLRNKGVKKLRKKFSDKNLFN